MNIPVLGDAVPKRGNFITQAIGQAILQLAGWRIEGEIPNAPKFVAIGVPHTSNWDFILVMLSMLALRIHISWMGKTSLFAWPYGIVMRWLGGVAIDRTAPHGVVGQMVEAFNQQDSLIICIIPEGTRKKVETWKTGFYHIAHQADVPILLIAFDYGNKTIRFGPTKTTTGDVEADIKQMQAHFVGVRGKYDQS